MTFTLKPEVEVDNVLLIGSEGVLPLNPLDSDVDALRFLLLVLFEVEPLLLHVSLLFFDNETVCFCTYNI
jgi:hypothetical protein